MLAMLMAGFSMFPVSYGVNVNDYIQPSAEFSGIDNYTEAIDQQRIEAERVYMRKYEPSKLKALVEKNF